MTRLLYTGSVKEIFEVEPPTETRFGKGYMRFGSDGLSVFDYGTLPWEIEGKGEDLYLTSLRFFSVLEGKGIPTHFSEDRGNREIGIHLARMLGYDGIEPGKTGIYRIPIECVFSRVVTPVSSLHGRLRKGEAKPEDYGLDHVPARGEVLRLPGLRTTFSTKIEAGGDVYKSLDDLARVAGLVGNESQRLQDLTLAAAEALEEDAADSGLILADGKFEFVMGPGRNLLVADTGYTWDENRFLVELPGGRSVDISKQFVRDVYTIMGWKASLKRAQKAHPEDRSTWPAPPEVTEGIKELCSLASEAVRTALTREPEGPDLKSVAQEIADTLDGLKDRYKREETGEGL